MINAAGAIIKNADNMREEKGRRIAKRKTLLNV